MDKVLIRLILLIGAFLALWLGLSQLNWLDFLKVEETKENWETKLSELLLEIYTGREDEADADATYLINKIKNKICDANKLNEDDFHLHLILKDEINAFALPDGQIVVYSGLIKECKSPDELAGVIAHEMAHIEQGHIMKKLAREFGISVIVGITAGSDMGTVQEIAHMLASSGYSRKLESEADEYGVDYMLETNIDPVPLADFMFRMSTMGGEMPGFMDFLSTHPDSEERALAIIEQVKGKERDWEPVMDEEDWEVLKNAHEAVEGKKTVI